MTARWTNLRGQTVHVHSVTTHYKYEPDGPIRCRGIAIMFPMDKEPLVIPIVGIKAIKARNKTTELKFTGLLQLLRRAKARRFKNFEVKMQVKTHKIDKDCPRYKELWRECRELMAELDVNYLFVKSRRRESMTENEMLVDDGAGFASRIQYDTREFPDAERAWLDERVMSKIQEQYFLPAFKETQESIEEELGWRISSRVQRRYLRLGFPIKSEDDDDSDDSD